MDSIQDQSDGTRVPFFVGAQASTMGEFILLPSGAISASLTNIANVVDTLLSEGAAAPTVIAGATGEGLYCYDSRTMPTVIEARQTVDEEYKLRWPEEALGHSPRRLIVESFYGGHYLVCEFTGRTADLFDRNAPVFERGRLTNPRYGTIPFSEMNWPEPFNNALNLQITSMVERCYRCLDEALVKTSAKLHHLSIRLGYTKDGRLAVSQLVEVRVERAGGIMVSLSESPEVLEGVLKDCI